MSNNVLLVCITLISNGQFRIKSLIWMRGYLSYTQRPVEVRKIGKVTVLAKGADRHYGGLHSGPR